MHLTESNCFQIQPFPKATNSTPLFPTTTEFPNTPLIHYPCSSPQPNSDFFYWSTSEDQPKQHYNRSRSNQKSDFRHTHTTPTVNTGTVPTNSLLTCALKTNMSHYRGMYSHPSYPSSSETEGEASKVAAVRVSHGADGPQRAVAATPSSSSPPYYASPDGSYGRRRNPFNTPIRPSFHLPSPSADRHSPTLTPNLGRTIRPARRDTQSDLVYDSKAPGLTEEASSDDWRAGPKCQSKTGKKVQYRKTRVCPWHTRGCCVMGDKCNYAHTNTELRIRPDLTRTRICPKGEACTDMSCRFAHEANQLRATGAFYRTKLCKYWMRGGNCPSGDHCRHAHGDSQLRLPDCSVAPEPEDALSLSRYFSSQTTGASTNTSRYSESSANGELFEGALLMEAVSQLLLFQGAEQQQHPTLTQEDNVHDMNYRYPQHGNQNGGSHSVRCGMRNSSAATTRRSSVDSSNIINDHMNDMMMIHHSSSNIIPGPLHIMDPSPTQHHEAPTGPLYDEDVRLKDILNFAVMSQDPDLLECSAKIIRASMMLKKSSSGM